MTKFALMAVAGMIAAAPMMVATVPAAAEGVEVHVGDRHDGIRVEGRRHHCRTVTTVVHRHGRTIRRTERKCD
jgi:hypothetical protein